MKTITTKSALRILRTCLFSGLLFIVVALAFASKGGGDKKKNNSFKNDFIPIRTTTGFTLKSGISYTGNHFLTSEKTAKTFSYSTIVTYQKGNTIYILPYKYKVNVAIPVAGQPKSNFQMLDFKINMHK
jgi:hypothetical protein